MHTGGSTKELFHMKEASILSLTVPVYLIFIPTVAILEVERRLNASLERLHHDCHP